MHIQITRVASVLITKSITLTVATYVAICNRILEKSSKSHMKSGVFLHAFNGISYTYLWYEY